MQIAEHHREQFELAYATAWAKDRDGGETPEQLAAEIKSWRIGDTYGEDLPSLRFGWEGYQWARAGQCLAQIEEPAQPVAAICSASHDDAQFGERAIKPLRDISGFDYGTPLYAGAAPAAVAPRARDLLGIVRTAQAEARRLINGEDSGSDLAQTKLDLPETLRVLEHALSQPAAVAGPASVAKFTDESTADPVEKARRYLKAMADETPNSVYFFGDGYPRRASSLDAKATLAVLEQLAALAAPALEAPAAPAVPLKATPEMRAAFRRAYREGAYRERGIWGNRVDYALDQMLAAAPQAPAAPSTHAGLLAAAAHIQAKAQAHLDERGSYDPDTGAVEMSNSNQEHFNTLDELAEEIRLMADQAAPASCDKPPAGWTCSRAPGHDGPCAAAPAAPAVDAFTHAELLEIQRAVSEFEDCNETDVDDALLLRAVQAGYLECSQYFHVADKSKLDSDTAAAQAAAKGEHDD